MVGLNPGCCHGPHFTSKIRYPVWYPPYYRDNSRNEFIFLWHKNESPVEEVLGSNPGSAVYENYRLEERGMNFMLQVAPSGLASIEGSKWRIIFFSLLNQDCPRSTETEPCWLRHSNTCSNFRSKIRSNLHSKTRFKKNYWITSHARRALNARNSQLV